MPRLIPPVLSSGTFRDQPQPTLTTANGLGVRPWEPGDARALVAAYEDPAIRFWHHRSMTTGEAEAWIAAAAESWREETEAEWAVTEGDRLVGRIGLRGVSLPIGQGEISYWTLPEARGRRAAPEALDRVASWALHEIGFWRLQVRHSVRNPASCQVATRAGFVEEAQLSRQHLHEDGWHDVHIHSRLRESADENR